jgi:hypothetical protein
VVYNIDTQERIQKMSLIKTTNISMNEFLSLRKQYHEFEKARLSICKSRNCITAEELTQLPKPCTHEEISKMEVFEFRHNPPPKYFAYVDSNANFITTWIGEILGTIVHYHEYKDNLGDKRAAIRVKAINDLWYYGTFFKSAGDYCRLKLMKNPH